MATVTTSTASTLAEAASLMEFSPINTVIFSTANSSYLADLLALQLGVRRGRVFRKRFGDGERYYRLELTERSELVGKDVIYVSSTHTDEDLLELIRVGTVLSQIGTRRRIFVVPFLGYSTMERAVKPGECPTAKVNLKLMSAIPNSGLGNVFLLLDLHVQGLLHYFEGDCIRIELYAETLLIESIKALNLSNFMFGTADLGRPLWVESFANKFNTDIAFIRKSRDGETTNIDAVVGDVAGKHVIIYDDMVRSAGTLIHAAEAYVARGALSVYAVVSHLALTNESIVKLIDDSPIVKLIATNSHPMSQCDAVKASPKISIIDCSSIFAQRMKDYIRV